MHTFPVMILFQVLPVLLFCSWPCHQAICTEEIICVANERGKELECPQNNATKIIYTLSNTTLNCTTVLVYMTSGSHILNTHLNFTDSVEETHIDGAPHGQYSTIMCLNKAGIIFSENRKAKVFLSNLAFIQCHYERETGRMPADHDQVALYFKYASYSLENVAVRNTEGYGIYAQLSHSQEIIKCTFNNNTQGHVKISSGIYANATEVFVKLIETKFLKSKWDYAVFIDVVSNATVSVRNNTFSDNANGGLYVRGTKHLEVKDCIITKNNGTGVYIDMVTGANISTSIVVHVSNCIVQDNTGTGLTIIRNSRDELMHMLTDISNITFTNNSRALYLFFKSWAERNDHRVSKISGCSFYNHRLSTEKSVVLLKNNLYPIKNNEVIIENCSFSGNQGASVLYVDKMKNITLNNVDIYDNDCTGIVVIASMIKIKNHLHINRNSGWRGGAISLSSDYIVSEIKFSQLLLAQSSTVSISNNTAETYGGGIFTNETCETRNLNHTCFFQFESALVTPLSVFKFSGNSAKLGGDMVLGGCLLNCSIQTWITIDKTDPNNTLWDVMSFENLQSQSTLVEYPKRALFCTNTSTPAIICNNSYTASAFRGQTITVPLMAGDDSCFPTSRVVKVRGEKDLSLLSDQQVIETTKYCHNFPYALAGAIGQNTTTIEFNFQDPFAAYNIPAVLTVDLTNCPPGLNLDYSNQQCKCHEAFKSHKIACHSDRYTLEISAQTWVGEYEQKLIVQKECQYCKNEASEQSIGNLTDLLCTANRSGIMCGQCIEGHSLKLGGHECASCSKSPLVGVILVITFASAGVILVLLLLRLDLTVSTGTMNGLIFYSNIVYLNSDVFLPINRESSTHLQNVVKMLSTFQAWMNLDFGITTCFFDGYSTYISTWMQFVFPLYIWLLILMIVLASWYSSIVAKVTTSNTVSVLATLLLLSYAKLLKTSIETFSSVRLFSLDGKSLGNVWKQDGNIPYLGRFHVPLFLMSLLMVIVYIIPFTFLILLGPLLRAKSHYWFLRWIHKIKPFLDAFYGPYTIRYRYWPGLLLFTRLAIIGIFASHSTNDSLFKLMTISMMVLMLFIIWLVIGRIHTVSFYRKHTFNYLELFFLSNLGTIAVVSLYISQFADSEKRLRNKQALAAIMVGSVLIVFCGIITRQISSIVFKFRAMQKILNSIQTKLKQLVRKKQEPLPQLQETTGDASSTSSINVTHTVVDLQSSKLREPLLTN